MSWSWSHTNEAYENARQNLGKLGIETLLIILAEWAAFEPDDPEAEFASASTGQLNEPKYKAELKRLRKEMREGRLAKEDIADAIWERASELATCTNGGWEAWMCPFGCGCHMVSFSTWKERMDEARAKKKAERDREKYRSALGLG